MTHSAAQSEPQSASSYQIDMRQGEGISIVTPMMNEEGGAYELVEEIHHAMQSLAPLNYEVIVVDDASSDRTIEKLEAARQAGYPVRIIAHGENAGQSRAIRTGVLAANYAIIGMIDGDGQNNPVDIPRLFNILKEKSNNNNEVDQAVNSDGLLAMIAGERQKRQDSGAKRYASRFANGIRQKILADGAADSGCGLKVFYRDAFLRLPYFDHLHRYLPFLMQREGYLVAFAPVGHRARSHGASKYTNLGRLIVAFRDLAGVLWLKARARSPKNISER